MNSRKEVEAFVKLVQSIVDKKEIGKKRPGVITNIDRETNHMTILLSDGSHQTIEIQTDAPYTIGDSVNIVPDGTVSLMGESSTPIGGNELLSNGDFALGNLKYWNNYELQTVAINTDEHFTGTYSCVASVRGPWETFLYQDILTVAVIPGELYKHEGYFKTDSSDGILVWLDATWYTSDAQEINIDYQKSEEKAISSDDDWVRLVTYNRAPPEASYIRVKYCILTVDKSVSIYFDNLSFWGKSQSLPATSIPGLPGLDNVPPCDVTNASGEAGVSLVVDTYNYYVDVHFDHIDTEAYSSGESSLIWDNTDFDHYEIYYRSGANEYELAGVHKTPTVFASGEDIIYRVLNLAEETTYDFLVKSVDQIGNMSSGVYVSGVQTLYNKAPKKPDIDTDKSEFLTTSAEVFWEPVVLNFDDTSAAIGGLTSDIKDYKIEVECSGGLVRTEWVNSTHYTYTLEKNLADNSTVQPSGLFRIYARDFGDKLSSGSDVTLINYPPAQPSSLSSDFTTRDAKFWWTPVTTDSEGNGLYDFDTYKVVVTPSGGSPVTYYTKNPTFTYSYEDNTNQVPNVSVDVTALDKLTQESVAAETTAINLAPSQAPTPTATAGFKKVLVEWTSIGELAQTDSNLRDITKTNLAHSNASGGPFTTFETTQPDNFYVHDVAKDTHNYYKVQFVDIFNQSGDWSNVSDDAYTEDSISIEDMAGELFQLQATTSYSGTYYGASGENDITKLYDADWTSPVDFGTGEQWIEYAFPVTHIFNKTHIAFASGDEYNFFLAYKRASGDEWTYLAGLIDNLSEYDDMQDAYSDLITYSGTDVMLKWNTMREAQYCRFYFPSGTSEWTENKLCELKFDTYIIADQIDAGTINLAKGINLYNDEIGSGFRLTSEEAYFENGFITVVGDGYTVIADGEIYVRASGGTNPTDLNYYFDEENNSTVLNGGYIKTGSVDANVMRFGDMGYFINRVKNPSLEVSNPDYDHEVPEYWNYYSGTVGSLNYQDNYVLAKFGRRYLELQPANDGSPTDWYFFSDPFKVSDTGIFTEIVNPSGEYITVDDLKYTASCYISASSGTYINVLIDEYEPSGESYGELINTRYLVSGYAVDYDSNYLRQALTFTPTEGTFYMSFKCEMDPNVVVQPSGGWARFDAFQIEEGNQATGFKVTYDLGTVILDSSGIIVDHSLTGGSRTRIDKEGITVERGRIFVITDTEEQIDLIDEIKIGGNLLYNPGWELYHYDGNGLKPDAWNIWLYGDSAELDYFVDHGYPDQENKISAHYLAIDPSLASGDFARFSSIKIPVLTNTTYIAGGYYYIPPGTDDVSVNIYLRMSSSFDAVNDDYTGWSGDTTLSSLQLTPCSSSGEWEFFELDKGTIPGEGQNLYITIEVLPSGDCATTDLRFDSFSIERGDKVTRYDKQSQGYVEQRFSSFKDILVHTFNDMFIASGLGMEVI